MLYHKSNCSRILIGSIDGQSGDDVINMFLFLYYIKQIDSLLPCVCSVIDHRGRQNMARTSMTRLVLCFCVPFLFLPHFDVICDLLLNRRTATWNLFVNLMAWVVIDTRCQTRYISNNAWRLLDVLITPCERKLWFTPPSNIHQGRFASPKTKGVLVQNNLFKIL